MNRRRGTVHTGRPPGRRTAAHGDKYTSEDLQFILDNPRMSTREMAAILDRTMKAMTAARSKAKRGELRTDGGWTKSEIEFVKDHPYYTARQLADILGRTPIAVGGMRYTLRIKFGYEGRNRAATGPNAVGDRRLLARTCISCGLLFGSEWYYFDQNAGNWSARCRLCLNEKQNEHNKRHPDKVRARDLSAKVQNDISRSRAINAGKQWTDMDVRVLEEIGKSSFQKALQLGRSISAVNHAMVRFGLTNRIELGDPEDGQWYIKWDEQAS